MIVKVITCNDVDSSGIEREFISHGIDVDTLENVVLQSIPIDEFISRKLVMFDGVYGWILS